MHFAQRMSTAEQHQLLLRHPGYRRLLQSLTRPLVSPQLRGTSVVKVCVATATSL